jgi:hypothetical protein
MLPKFPEFKKLELTDKKEIEKITTQYPPYSDFNFVSMWSWDIKGEMRVSDLNGNLVVRFTDYVDQKKVFYSFLGKYKVEETAATLLELSKKEKLEPILALVPEDSVVELDKEKFSIVEDRDHFDYIYHTATLMNLTGNKLRNKRNQVGYFIKKFPKAEIRLLNLGDTETRDDIIRLYKKWFSYKILDNFFQNYEHHELEAIKRLFISYDKFNLISVGIFEKNKLVAFFINELTESSYCLGLIAKAEISMQGIYAFLRKKNAEIISSFNKEFMNDEQDLGIEKLRDAKMQFRHHSFLKKYKVQAKEI